MEELPATVLVLLDGFADGEAALFFEEVGFSVDEGWAGVDGVGFVPGDDVYLCVVVSVLVCYGPSRTWEFLPRLLSRNRIELLEPVCIV